MSMRLSQYVLVALGALAASMTLSAPVQSPADTTLADTTKAAASEAPATPTATSTSPAGATTASSGTTSPANPVAAAGAPGVATSTAATTQAPATPSSTINTTSAKNSADVLKQARQLGLRPETSQGVTRYCRTDASLGTRFPTKKCYDEAGLAMLADQIRIQKTDMMRGSDYCPAVCFYNFSPK
jgi:hypothetical protein